MKESSYLINKNQENSHEKSELYSAKVFLKNLFIVISIVTSIILPIAKIPAEPVVVLARNDAVLVLIASVSILITFAVQAVMFDWHKSALERVQKCARMIGKRGAVFTAMYLLGIFVLEKLGIAPPANSWEVWKMNFWSFVGTYTAFVFLCLYLCQLAQNSREDVSNSQLCWNSFWSVYAHIKPIAYYLAVPVYIAGLVTLEWIGIAPAFSFTNITDRSSLSFLSVYTVGFLFVPAFLAILVYLTFHLAGFIGASMKLAGNSEAWIRFSGVKLNPRELESELKKQRARKDELKNRWRIQRSEELEAELKQRQLELKEFGPITARMLWWSPVLTFGAQGFSFLTSLLGIKIYLNLRQENVEWFGFNLPGFVTDLGFSNRFSFMSNDVLAIAASFFMAILIWALSHLAVGRVRRFQSVPFVVYFFVILLGMASTYTAFIFWNGEVATSEQLRIAQRETRHYLVEIENVDERNLISLQTEAANLRTQILNFQLEKKVEVLRGHLLELQLALDDLSQGFSSVSKLGYYLESGREFYKTFEHCERNSGCLSNLKGNGQVAKSLSQNVQAFSNNHSLWNQISGARKNYSDVAQTAFLAAIVSLQKRDLKNAQIEVARGRMALIELMGEDPSVIYQSIRSRLSIPIASDAPTESQREALTNLQEGIDAHLDELQLLEEKVNLDEFALPAEIRLDQIGLELTQDAGLLAQVEMEITDLLSNRTKRLAQHYDDLQGFEDDVEEKTHEKSLVVNSARLFFSLNNIREKIVSLRNIDQRPIMAKLGFLQSDFAKKVSKFDPTGKSLETYAAIGEFKPVIIALSIIIYAQLSVVPLLIQIMLDFGFTLIVIIVASRLKREQKLDVDATA